MKISKNQVHGMLVALVAAFALVSCQERTAGTINGHEYVDLGMSVKWATCNVGASSPEDYGDYFAWGETNPKETYTYKTCLTYEKKIGCISGNPQYDAATANWGGGWRMPADTEWKELAEKCEWKWTSQDGHMGCLVTGPNGNSIFLPAAGERSDDDSDYRRPLEGAEEYCEYWSGTPFDDARLYEALLFGVHKYDGEDNISRGAGDYYRSTGCPIRPVSGEILKPSYTDLEILGFIKGMRRIHISTESEVSWQYYFDEKGMLTKCEYLDECGNDTYVFDGEILVSSTAIWYEDMGSDDAEIFIYKFSYKEENKTHSIVYKTKEGSDEKTKFADIFYDEEGRITSIEREQGNEQEKVNITYGEDNMPINDKGKTTVAKLELLGMPIINSNDFHLERGWDGQEYYWNPNEMLTLEIYDR